MSDGQVDQPFTAKVVLQGGGKLDRVARIHDVRLELGELTWSGSDDELLEVRGEIYTYLYYVRPGSSDVEGEGLTIPFTRRIPIPANLSQEPLEVELADLASEHDYNPVTGDFQHQVIINLNIAAKRKDPPPSVKLGQAEGEVRLSQIRVRDDAKEQGEKDGAEPKDDSDMIEQTDSGGDPAETLVPTSLTEEIGDEKDDESEESIKDKNAAEEQKTSEEPEVPETRRESEPLVWKPFPPSLT